VFHRLNGSPANNARSNDGGLLSELAQRVCVAVSFACFLTGGDQLVLAAPAGTSDVRRASQEDADLTDVCFVDELHGWAVGDRGVIWYTEDGGKRWQLQDSRVDCRLESVHFLDMNIGWAAGGVIQPYSETTRGVLLHTRDGGRNWGQDQGLVLPALKQVRFFDGAQGWAIGEASSMWPVGVFTTTDGGRSWSPWLSSGVVNPGAPGSQGGAANQGPSPNAAATNAANTMAQSWLAGDFLDPLNGAVAGRRGSLGTLRRRVLEEARTPTLGLRGLQRLKLVAPTGGWLVGDGGLVLTTEDLGRSWQLPLGPLPPGMSDQFDWRALEIRGNEAWVAGSPGTRVLHTADGGRTWQAHATGQNVPLADIAFVGSKQGWAVGALGVILASKDGGRTWHRQRGGGTRTAILGLFSEAEALPLELFARFSGNDGYLGVAELLTRRDVEPGQLSIDNLPERAQAALVGAGGSAAHTAWAFPLRQRGLNLSPEQLVEGWNRAHDGRGVQKLEAYLIRQIRCWRPEVVLTHAATARSDDPLGQVINQIVLRSVEQAADPTRFPEQITQAGLEPWQAKKVLGCLPNGQLGTINLTTSQVAPRLGTSLADYASGPRGLLESQPHDYTPPLVNVGCQVLIDHIPQGLGARDVLSGIVLHPGGEARRWVTEVPTQGMDQMRQAALRHRNVQAILSRPEQPGFKAEQFAGQVGDLTRGLDESSAGDVLYQLGQRFDRTGRGELAAETFQMLTDRYPKHSLAQPALVWLLHYYASREAAWRTRNGGQVMLANHLDDSPATSGIAPPSGQVVPASGGTSNPPAMSRMHVAAPIGIIAARTPSNDRPARAVAIGKQIAERYPSVYAEPRVQFPLATAQREAGFGRSAEKFYLSLLRSRPHDAWWTCAAAEQWLDQTQPIAPPKSLWRTSVTGVKPRLDGRLDDAVWQTAKPVELRSTLRDDTGWPAVAMLAYDQEFLYLAVNCRQAPGCKYETNRDPRPRDADLSAHDRVDLCLDLDRDWVTYYRLTIDHRGWTREACSGDTTWNPTWFVAAASTETSWTVEAAIPWEELTGQPPTSKDVWAAGVQRTAPGGGFQSWTTPASTQIVPEGFGYLTFDAAAVR
jgi:photosystem II stability/assembly factor-like uncharacterized protein